MKPLLSELFLPCSGKHSPMRANRCPLTTITGAQRASGQTHSRARSHQDGADLRADRSTAYLVSCIRVCSAHGNSLNHLVGAQQKRFRHREAKRMCGGCPGVHTFTQFGRKTDGRYGIMPGGATAFLCTRGHMLPFLFTFIIYRPSGDLQSPRMKAAVISRSVCSMGC